jgi:predicted RNase H-like HicB family nuclease
MPGADDMMVTVEIHEEDGSYWATVDEMPGVFASGDTMHELEEALAEAIGMYVAPAGEKFPGVLERVVEPSVRREEMTFRREFADA